MRSVSQISPEQTYELFPHPKPPKGNTFFCMVIEECGAHPYLRTGDAYEYIEDRDFVSVLMETFPGCLRHSDIPYSDRQEQFTIKIEPFKLVDQVLVDRRTGQAYREIQWT